MSKLICVIGDYKILAIEDGYVVINKRGDGGNHSHFKKLDTCHVIIRLIKNKMIPKSAYLVEAAKRLTLEGDYKQKLIVTQMKQEVRQIRYKKRSEKSA